MEEFVFQEELWGRLGRGVLESCSQSQVVYGVSAGPHIFVSARTGIPMIGTTRILNMISCYRSSVGMQGYLH